MTAGLGEEIGSPPIGSSNFVGTIVVPGEISGTGVDVDLGVGESFGFGVGEAFEVGIGVTVGVTEESPLLVT